jgi:hypothetical protein
MQQHLLITQAPAISELSKSPHPKISNCLLFFSCSADQHEKFMNGILISLGKYLVKIKLVHI